MFLIYRYHLYIPNEHFDEVACPIRLSWRAVRFVVFAWFSCLRDAVEVVAEVEADPRRARNAAERYAAGYDIYARCDRSQWCGHGDHKRGRSSCRSNANRLEAGDDMAPCRFSPEGVCLMRKLKKLAVCLCLLSAGLPLSAAPQHDQRNDSMPLVFEPNRGQAPDRYQFLARRSGVETRYSTNGMDIVVPSLDPASSHVHLRWAGANPHAVISGEEALPGHSNYILGSDESRWVRGVPQFGGIRYKRIYRGIDLVFHGSADQLENDFLLNPTPIRTRFACVSTVLHECSQMAIWK